MRAARSFGDPNRGGLSREEGVEERGQLCIRPVERLDLAARIDRSEVDLHVLLAVQVIAELQVVGQDEVVQASEVALQLVSLLGFIQGDVDVLALDEAERDVFTGHDEVRRAACHTLGLVGGTDAFAEGFDERLECRAVTVFGGVPGRVRLPDRAKVRIDGILHIARSERLPRDFLRCPRR